MYWYMDSIGLNTSLFIVSGIHKSTNVNIKDQITSFIEAYINRLLSRVKSDDKRVQNMKRLAVQT